MKYSTLSPKNKNFIASAIVITMALFPTISHAANATWVGGGTDTYWNTTGNWASGNLPSTTGIAYLSTGGTMTIGTSATCGGIWSTSSSQWSVLITGSSPASTLTFAASGAGTPAFYVASSWGKYETIGNLTIAGTQGLTMQSGGNAFVLASNLTWSLSGTLYLNPSTNQGAVVYAQGNNVLPSTDLVFTPGNSGSNYYLNNSRLILNGSTTQTIGALNSTITSNGGSVYISAWDGVTMNMGSGFTSAPTTGSNVTPTIGNTASYATLRIGSGNNNGNFMGTIGRSLTYVTGSTGTIDSSAAASAINIVKTGSGTQTFSGTNYYIGTTTVEGGTLKAGVANQAFGVNSAVILANTAGVVLDLNSYNQAIGSLSGGGNNGGNVTLGTATLTIGGDNANTTFAGVISGAGALTKIGTGCQVLSGSNTYTGATIVTGGTLAVNGSLAAGSTVSVTSAVLAGSGTVGGSVNGTSATINGSGLSLGATTLYGSSTLSGINSASSVNVAGGTTALSGTTTAGFTVGNSAKLANNGLLSGNITVNGGGLLNGSGVVSGTVYDYGNINGSLTFNNDVTVNSGATASAAAFNGNVINNGTITSAVNVLATKTLSGTGAVTGAVTVSGTTNPGNNGGTGKLTVDLTYNTGATANFNVSSSSSASGLMAGTSGLYYSQIVVSGTAGTDSLQIGSVNQTLTNGASNSGVTLKLAMSASDFAMLVDGATHNYIGGGSNNTLANYFVFDLDTGLTSSGKFETLTLDIGGTLYNGIIYYSGANDRFDGVSNLGDVYVTVSGTSYEFAISYVGDSTTNSTTGGNDIVLTAVPEPFTWAMIVSGMGMLAFGQRIRRKLIV